jgi:glycosyltransferase involved in cell wall biosynthesis
VLVEALASAKPIVSTRFPHAEELLSGGAGVLVEQGDVEAMAAAINRIFCEPEFAARLRAAARRVAVPLLWSSVAGKYCALLDRVIGEEVRI